MVFFNPQGFLGFFSLSAVLVILPSRQMLSALALLLLSTYAKEQVSQGLVNFHFHQVCFALPAVEQGTNKRLQRRILAPNIGQIIWQVKAQKAPQLFLSRVISLSEVLLVVRLGTCCPNPQHASCVIKYLSFF